MKILNLFRLAIFIFIICWVGFSEAINHSKTILNQPDDAHYSFAQDSGKCHSVVFSTVKKTSREEVIIYKDY